MAMLTMPILVANLGCEMLYILDQRLRAHEVEAAKAAQVLDDIATFIFDEAFVNTIFGHHEMYSVRSTHLIFSRLAHSSIMRLSTSSMEKLFDLILMGVKMQLMVSVAADEMLAVTRRHLNTARPLLAGSAWPLMDAFQRRLSAAFDMLTPGQWHTWRLKTTSFFLDRRIKVSLFLQEGLQARDGHFYLRPPRPAAGGERVGTVKRLRADGSVADVKEVRLACHDEDPNEYFCHPAELGDNLYSATRPKVLPPPRGDVPLRQRANLATAPSLGEAILAGNDRTLQGLPSMRVPSELEALSSDVGSRQEHDMLRHMFGARPAARAEFKLSLFDDEPTASEGGGTGEYVGDLSSKVRVLDLAAAGNRQYAAKLAAGMEGVEEGRESQEDDLLAMMDEAVGS